MPKKGKGKGRHVLRCDMWLDAEAGISGSPVSAFRRTPPLFAGTSCALHVVVQATIACPFWV